MHRRITRKALIDWAGRDIVRDAENLLSKGHVLSAEVDEPYIRGAILWNNRELKTALRMLPDGNVESECPCYANRERGIICSHVIALGLTIVKRATDPLREAKYQEERRRAERLARFKEEAYLKRVPPTTPGALPARLRLILPTDWEQGVAADKIPLRCEITVGEQSLAIEDVSRDLALTFNKPDESALYVLEDVCEGPTTTDMALSQADFSNVLRLLAPERLFVGETPILVGRTPLSTHLKMDLDHETGELIVIAHTELPLSTPGRFPTYLVGGREAWIATGCHIWPLEKVLPGPYQAVYAEPVIVTRQDVIRFLTEELPRLREQMTVESGLSLDLFTVEPATPAFRLAVRGSPASLSAELLAVYDTLSLVAAKPDAREHFAIPDPTDLLGYKVRNRPAEAAAVEALRQTGFVGSIGDDLSSIVGKRLVLGFLGTHLPALRRRGWKIDLDGRVAPFFEDLEFATPVVHVQDQSEGAWFDVSFDFEDTTGSSLSHAEIQRALLRGESFLDRGGRTILIDGGAIDSMTDVFNDCQSAESDLPGHFRMDPLYAPYVQSSLDGLDGIDVESTPTWRQQTSRQNRTMRLAPVDLPPRLDGILRGYQKDGVNWLRFLETNTFCGLLADEMGLGKTLQTLTWLQMERARGPARDKPSLIVCPTSLVENWAEEAAKFTPDLKVVMLSGADRHDLWSAAEEADLVVTSYALLRRDLERHCQIDYAVAVLDEAQHIKNRSTRNAKAAKKIQAHHRLVLTGTPVENGVSDIWSIMDFLMPGYLGKHEIFRAAYELPIARGGPDGELAQMKLRRKLHPFLLRRLKADVAPDLPPKLTRISACRLTGDQQKVYKELVNASRRRLTELVKKQGFNRSRMEVLTTLMRLRQACCHLDLLKLPNLQSEYPSAKLDLFLELVNEAVDGGHRILVFSQFVSMLTILRKELESRDLRYCYLDGSTKNRLSVVHEFNTTREIPVFLISLKAGGTGLNLTGADMVIHFDPWWNPAVEDQATDRAYRIGQKRTVYNIKLITRDTIEEKVLELQKRKQAVINATVESDEHMVQSLSWNDIEELLSL